MLIRPVPEIYDVRFENLPLGTILRHVRTSCNAEAIRKILKERFRCR